MPKMSAINLTESLSRLSLKATTNSFLLIMDTLFALSNSTVSPVNIPPKIKKNLTLRQQECMELASFPLILLVEKSEFKEE
jgi:hypothetical protein